MMKETPQSNSPLDDIDENPYVLMVPKDLEVQFCENENEYV